MFKELKHNKHVRKQRRFKKEKWFDDDCEYERREYMSKKDCYVTGNVAQNEYTSTWKNYKNLIKRKKRAYTKSFHLKIRNLKTCKPKDFWNLINSECQSKSNTKQPVNFSHLVQHFTKLSSNTINESLYENAPIGIPDNRNTTDEINAPFTVEEICNIRKKLKNSKSPGVDNIVNEFLKYCPIDCIHVLCRFFNIIFNTGIVPTEWCLGIILPIYKKKGLPTDPDNYRGITLLSCVGKLFTACINHRLSLYIDDDILGKEQAGFREGYSTIDHIFCIA